MLLLALVLPRARALLPAVLPLPQLVSHFPLNALPPFILPNSPVCEPYYLLDNNANAF